MSLNECIVEDAALEWFGELGYSCLGAEALTPALSHGERGDIMSLNESMLRTLTRPLPAGEEDREAIRRLNPASPEATCDA